MERSPDRSYVRLLPFYWNKVITDDTGRRDRDWTVFPLLWGGTDTEEGSYFAFLPFWGETKGLFGVEDIHYRFFPLYLSLKDGEYEGTTVLWPLVHWGEGGGVENLRIMPFYSRKVRAGRSHRTSILWPLVSFGEEDLDRKHPSSFFFAFPFYGRVDADDAWARTVLFPLYSAAGSANGYSETNVLWPVYRRMEGPGGREALRVWPLFGRSRGRAGSRDDFYLWPIVWDREYPVPEGTVRSFSVVPFWRDTERRSPKGETVESDLSLWPLFRKVVRPDGSERFSTLSLLPFPWEEFDRVWRPLWTIFELRSGGPDRREGWDVLGGLLGWESAPGRASLRLLWWIRVPL